MMEYLKDDPDIVDCDLAILSNSPIPPAADGHYHVVAGVLQDHTWDECPENNDSNIRAKMYDGWVAEEDVTYPDDPRSRAWRNHVINRYTKEV